MSSSFTVNREDLAWAAGFFDGEGHVSSRGANFTITIPQVGRQVLDRFRSAVGVGKVYGPYIPRRETHQPQHRYHASGHPHVQAVCALLWCWLSPVKRRQFRDVLTATKLLAHSRYRPTTCTHGAVNTKSCRDCQHGYQRKYHLTEYGRAAHRERGRQYRSTERGREVYRDAARRSRLIRKTAHALLVAV